MRITNLNLCAGEVKNGGSCYRKFEVRKEYRGLIDYVLLYQSKI